MAEIDKSDSLKDPDNISAEEGDDSLYDDIDESLQESENSEPKKSLSELFCSPLKDFENFHEHDKVENFEKLELEASSPEHSTAGGKTPRGEEDVDLYEDLNEFDKQINTEELQSKLKTLEEKVSSLESKNAELESKLAVAEKKNVALRTNISSLYKTAKSEVERKDRQLKELQAKYDSMVFRRGANRASQGNKSNNEKLSKEFAHGKTFEVEKETECTILMGNTSISLSVESENFSQQRIERVTENLNQKDPSQKGSNLPPVTLKATDLEEGELDDKDDTSKISQPVNDSIKPSDKRPSRKRSRSKSRSPTRSNVRRKSPRVIPQKETDSRKSSKSQPSREKSYPDRDRNKLRESHGNKRSSDRSQHRR